jgi:hypothetical protein
MTEKLKDENAIKNLIGKNTALRFVSCMDTIITYVTMLPKKINDDYYYFTLEVFLEDVCDNFLAFESCEDVLYKRKAFQLFARTMDGSEVIELYHKKYND